MNIKKALSLFFLTYLLLLFSGCGGENPSSVEKSSDTPTFAYVTNGIDPFWDLCAAGVRIAEKEFGVQCEVLMPPKGVVDQKRMMEAMLAKGVDGVAVSPIDAENQTPFLNEVGQNTILITQDADAPKSDRLVYIGTNNYKAGRALGGLVKKAIPEGGEVMIFVGRLEQLNARQRRQGVIDELLNRPMQKLDQVKFDSVDASDLKAEGSNYIVLDTRTDNFDKAKAACIDAIREANKQNEIKVCGFDEQDALLQAILDGNAHGTISQQPWEYGYESIKMLKSIHEGKQPDAQYFELPFLVVDRSNVEEFWAKKKEMAALGKQQ